MGDREIAFDELSILVKFQKLRGRSFYRTAYYLPYVTSTVAAATVFTTGDETARIRARSEAIRAAYDPALTAPRSGQPPDLSDAQKTTIYQMVRKDASKNARAAFPTQIGAEVPPRLRALVQEGALGRKAGRGFYDYSANAPKAAPATASSPSCGTFAAT